MHPFLPAAAMYREISTFFSGNVNSCVAATAARDLLLAWAGNPSLLVSSLRITFLSGAHTFVSCRLDLYVNSHEFFWQAINNQNRKLLYCFKDFSTWWPPSL
ncbi:hypothetical protein VIGAN_06163200 [Vigna angularis var. angularis]|uniref:Uncharacterized protein n=1 Tax=Vigna angularis var. angularis TaxID=157739 RepID=A0A0S3SC64_PHAAN|nr:hypothetical protein VIGAN_06163200 [Vigna angularis var. angularis]